MPDIQDPSSPSGSDAVSLPDPTTAKAQYDQLLSEIEGVPIDELAPNNLDVPTAVRIALGAAPALQKLRPRLAVLPAELFDITQVDKMPRCALAAWYAHLVEVKRQDGAGVDAAVLSEASELRKTMLNDAEALARRGLLNADRVAEIRSGRGHLDLANDLVALAALFEGAWNTIRDKTPTTQQEVERAAELGPALLVAVALKESPKSLIEAKDLTAQAFTLFFNAYEECRRGVQFLRHKERDADELLPSLYTRQSRPPPKPKSAPVAQGAQPTAPAP